MKTRGKFERASSAKRGKLLRVYATSLLSLLLCCTMFVGTTMAWFTDSVSSSSSQITAGELKLEVKYGSPAQILSKDSVLFADVVWKPNHEETETLAVQNKGNLPFRYIMKLEVKEDDCTDAEGKVLSNADRNALMEQYTVYIAENNDAFREVGTLKDIISNKTKLADDRLEDPENQEATGKTYRLKLKMLETAEIKYMGQSLGLIVTVNAYQEDIPDSEIEGDVPSDEPDDGGTENVFETVGSVVPEGGVYTKADNTVLNPGSELPATPAKGDKFVLGNYEYIYNQYKGANGELQDTESVTGWSLYCNQDISNPGNFVASINGNPITVMTDTFAGCASMTTAPAIPDTVVAMVRTFKDCVALEVAPVLPGNVKQMIGTFRGCTSLTTAPVIPSEVRVLQDTFNGCTSLTGTITVNCNMTAWSRCLYGTKITGVVGEASEQTVGRLMATIASEASNPVPAGS